MLTLLVAGLHSSASRMCKGCPLTGGLHAFWIPTLMRIREHEPQMKATPYSCMPYLLLQSPGQGGVYFFLSENDIYSPPFQKKYFSPSHDTPLFNPRHALFVSLILPFYFLFSHFLSPFPPFSFFFLPICLAFSPFFSSPFHIFSPNDIGWHPPPSRGGGYFPIYRPWPRCW